MAPGARAARASASRTAPRSGAPAARPPRWPPSKPVSAWVRRGTALPGAAPEQQPVTVTVQEAGASLTLSAGPPALEFELPKVPGPEAASRLQALTLSLAERVCALERRLAAAEEIAASPKKSPWPVGPQQFLPDPDSQRGCPGPGAKRRCPGESLINPGFKSKKPASGVDFDDL